MSASTDELCSACSYPPPRDWCWAARDDCPCGKPPRESGYGSAGIPLPPAHTGDDCGVCEEAASGKFVDQVARSARLYQRGLITAQEFTNVTLGDLHRLDERRLRDDLYPMPGTYRDADGHVKPLANPPR